MKKELCAIAALLLLFAGALGNWIHLKDLMTQISVHTEYSMLYCSLEDYPAAHSETSKALTLWNDAEHFTHMVLRHSDIDAVCGTFFDILSAVNDREKYEAEYLLKKLRHQTESILNAETLSLSSVF